MDYEIQACSRHCEATGRELAPGEWYYSALVYDGDDVRRADYALDAWQEPPADCLGWWKAQVPDRAAAKKHWAPNDVMLQFFDELAESPGKEDMRYVLALLLVRRRVMRMEEERREPDGSETLVLYCPRRDATYEVPSVMPPAWRVEQIQADLAGLLQ